jgi:hypothetical protein
MDSFFLSFLKVQYFCEWFSETSDFHIADRYEYWVHQDSIWRILLQRAKQIIAKFIKELPFQQQGVTKTL